MGSHKKVKMTETERIVRIFHESWDLRDPERGTTSAITIDGVKLSLMERLRWSMSLFRTTGQSWSS